MTVVGRVGNIPPLVAGIGVFESGVGCPYTQPPSTRQLLRAHERRPADERWRRITVARERAGPPKLPMASMKTMADLRAAMVADVVSAAVAGRGSPCALLLCLARDLRPAVADHRSSHGRFGVRLALGARPQMSSARGRGNRGCCGGPRALSRHRRRASALAPGFATDVC